MTAEGNTKSILREERGGEAGRYIQEWRCAPPPIGKLFRISHDEWDTDPETGMPRRIVYEWSSAS